MITPLQDQAINLIELIEKKDEEYQELNRYLHELQGDFYSHIEIMNEKIHSEVVSLIDNILGDTIASYYLYECPSTGGCITEHDGTEYTIRTIDDVRAYVGRDKGE